MHILYDHQMFSIQRFGGISRLFVELMRELSLESGCCIHWHRGLYIDAYRISAYRPRLKRYWAASQVPCKWLRSRRDGINRFTFKWFVRTFGRRYDIYHPTYYDASLPAIAGAKTVAITICDMIPEKYLSGLARFKRLIEDKRALVERADLIFVISKHTRDDLLEMIPVEPEKVRVTYLASRIKETEAAPVPAVCRERPYFLYVGTRSKYKNFDALMRVFASDQWLRSNFRVICFGGTGPYLQSELEFFDRHDLRNNFVYLSGDDALLKTLYQNAQALVYTSRYEGFGLPLLEAMQCGCPVVCGRHSSIPEVVGDAAVFFDVPSPEELAQCMRTIVEDSSRRATLIQKGLLRSALFSWKKTASVTLAGYKAIAG